MKIISVKAIQDARRYRVKCTAKWIQYERPAMLLRDTGEISQLHSSKIRSFTLVIAILLHLKTIGEKKKTFKKPTITIFFCFCFSTTR